VKQEIESKLERLEQRVSRLREHSDTTLDELEEDNTLRSAIERNFQVALEIVLDTCSMVVSYEELEKPDDYRDMILELGEAGILPDEFAERFEAAAGFRNVLVHQYADVDVERLHGYLTENLDDFDTFAREIAAYAEGLEE
ncbi:MAG: DUF86 domain-containing protein, partial [Candidatus Nanohaloarchaea archaeon]